MRRKTTIEEGINQYERRAHELVGMGRSDLAPAYRRAADELRNAKAALPASAEWEMTWEAIWMPGWTVGDMFDCNTVEEANEG